MSRELTANNVNTTFAASASNSATSFTVAATYSLPSGTYRAVTETGEIVLVTNISGTTWTVTRAREGTTAGTYAAGDSIVIGPTRDGLLAAAATATYGEAYLGTDYTITTSDGTFEDTGVSVALPEAGTYLIWYDVRGSFSTSGSDGFAFIVAQLRDAGGAVANSTRLVYESPTSAAKPYIGQTGFHKFYTATGPATIKLYAACTVTTSTPGTLKIQADNNGLTGMGFVRVA